MKMQIAVIGLALLGATAHAATPNDEKTKLAIELMDVTHSERNVHAMIDQIPTLMKEQMKSVATCDAAKPIVEQFSADMSEKLTTTMFSDDFKVDTAAVYAEVFTEDELRQIIAFYRTPIGEKMLARMPELMQKSMQIAQQRMASVMPEIKKLGETYGPQMAEACHSSKSDTTVKPKL
jgi:uncharacterized protein